MHVAVPRHWHRARGGDPELAGLGREALNAALRGAELVQRLLAFSRRQPLRPQVLDLGGVATELQPLLERSLGANIQIETRIRAGLWPVMADSAQFDNVVLNLAINARDAMPHGGPLTINCANAHLDEAAASACDIPPGDYAVLSVADTGTGIPPEVLPHVFEPFFTTKDVGKGSGLGLSMVYGYARQSGGAVKIYSELGLGTEVRLYLPRALDAVEKESLAPKTEIPVARNRERILLVEDQPEVRKLAVRLLRDLGYEPTAVEGAEAALALVQRGDSFDLLFTDIVMPGLMNGTELAHAVRQRVPELPVLFTSGFSDPPPSQGAGEAALSASLIGKPYRKADLARAVRAALDAKPARVPEPA
jgi:CheY-like chemotaxis protein